ncbi:MAG: hypothetical protein WA705_21870 [Candidatus Ozemobacteraceae bacterium]
MPIKESRAIHEVFGEYAPHLPVSSIKPFVGYLLTAAGAVEAVASLVPFLRGILPPTLHLETLDPACPLDVIPNLARPARPDVVMTNSYGLGGQNCITSPETRVLAAGEYFHFAKKRC